MNSGFPGAAKKGIGGYRKMRVEEIQRGSRKTVSVARVTWQLAWSKQPEEMPLKG